MTPKRPHRRPLGLYVRKKDSDTWHWVRTCSRFPRKAPRVFSPVKPTSGEFCDECLAKVKRGVIP